MVAFGREPCTHTIVQKPGADALLRRLICDHCPPANFDRVVCKHGYPPKVNMDAAWQKSAVAAHPEPPRDTERTPGQRELARNTSPAQQPRVPRGRGHVMAEGPDQHRRFAEERLRPRTEDLRQSKKQAFSARTAHTGLTTRAPSILREDRRQGYSRDTRHADEGEGAWTGEPRLRGDTRRSAADHPAPRSPEFRQFATGEDAHVPEHERRKYGGPHRFTYNARFRSPPHEPSRGCSGRPMARAHSRDAFRNEAVTETGQQQASQEYLPPAPARRDSEGLLVSQLGQPTAQQTTLPVVEHAYVRQGLPGSAGGGQPLALGASNLQEQFQAAVAVAVQEVVKSMGIMPSAATGGVAGVLPSVLGGGPAVVQPEIYGSPGRRQHAERNMQIAPQHAHARSVQPEPLAPSMPMRGDERHLHAEMDAGEMRYMKRSRVSPVSHGELPGLPPAHSVMPRHASPGSRHARLVMPQRDRAQRHAPSDQRDDRSTIRSVGNSHSSWRSPPPATNMPGARERSPKRRRSFVAPGRDSEPVHDNVRDKWSTGRGHDWNQSLGRNVPRVRQGPERRSDRRTRHGEHKRSPSLGRPPLHDSPCRQDRSSNLPLPPPHDVRAGAGARTPAGGDLRSGGTGQSIRGPSPSACSYPANRVADQRVHNHAGMHDRRGRPDGRMTHDRRPHCVQSVAREIISGTPTIKLRSGGSRVADRRRTIATARPGMADNEDAFAVEYNCFAIGDGFEGKESAQRAAFNSGKFTHELVTQATGFATSQIQVYVSERGRNLPLMGPIHVLQQASNSVRSTGAAAVLLGMLNPFSGRLSIGKVGDVGYLVLRPPGPDDASKDLKVCLTCLVPCLCNCLIVKCDDKHELL